jgi:hypothetical protein
MSAKEIGTNANCGLKADGTPVEGLQGAIDAHRAASEAYSAEGNSVRAAYHAKEASRREADRAALAAQTVVSHKAGNLDANGEPVAYVTPKSLRVTS